MAEFRIRIIIDPSGAEGGSRRVRRELNGIEQQAERVRGAMNRALAFAGVTVGIGGLVQLADAYTNIQNRLRTVTEGTEQLADVTDRLLGIANDTRQSFATTAQVYSRVASSAQALGLSQKELLDFQLSLNQAVALSGATSQEASNALIQLAQGLGAGALRGEELNSVLEQLPTVADIIAERLGVTRGELKGLAEDGKITAGVVVEAFEQAREKLAEDFANSVPTIGQAFEVLRNNVTALVGEFLSSSGTAQAFAQAILFIGENLDNIIPLLLSATGSFLAFRAAATVSAVLGPMIALERALGATSVAAALYSIAMKAARGATIGLTAAIAANPIGFLIVAVTTAISLLYVFSDEIKVSEDGLVTLGDVAAATWSLILDGISGVTDFLASAWEGAVEIVNGLLAFLGTNFSEVMSGVLSFAKAAINGYIGLWVFAYKAVQIAWSNFPGAMDAFFTAVVNFGASAAEMLLNAWQVPLRLIAGGLSIISDEAGAALSGFLDNFNIRIPRRVASEAGKQFGADLQQAAVSSLSEDYIGNVFGEIMKRASDRELERYLDGLPGEEAPGAGPPARPGAGGDGASKTKKQTDELERQRKVLSDWARETSQEIALLGLSNRERERAEEVLRLENDLKRELTETERKLVNARLDELQAARDARAIADVVEDLERENDILAANVNEREARAEVLRLEAQLGRQLNAAEEELVTTLVQQNEALRDSNRVYEELNGRREEAIRQLEAIKRLRATVDVGDETGVPAISELDARNAREGIGLVQDLRDVDRSLGGDFEQQAELDQIRAFEDERMAIIRDALAARLITEQEAAERRVALEADTQRRIRELQAAQASLAIQSAQSTAESLTSIAKDLAGEQSSIYRAMFVAAKAFAIADSIIKIQQGIANALSLPFPANIAAVAAVAAQAASIVSNIKAISLQFAEGGLVQGPGTGTSDSIVARLSNGEYVVNARATSENLGLLQAINSGQRFRDGGLVGANDNRTFGFPGIRSSSTGRPANDGMALNISIENYSSASVAVERLGPNDVRIIAKEEAKKVLSEDLADTFAAEMSRPNSRAREAVVTNTSARPAR